MINLYLDRSNQTFVILILSHKGKTLLRSFLSESGQECEELSIGNSEKHVCHHLMQSGPGGNEDNVSHGHRLWIQSISYALVFQHRAPICLYCR